MVLFTIVVAPVRVQGCVTVLANQRHVVKVTRPKDSIAISTPVIFSSEHGSIDGTEKLRNIADNRGALAPQWATPFQLDFDAASPGKRTVWIHVVRLDGAEGKETVVATARLDLLCLCQSSIVRASIEGAQSVAARFSKSDLFVPLIPNAELMSSIPSHVPSLMGRRCLVDVDVLMFPSAASSNTHPPSWWPVPDLPVSSHARLTRSRPSVSPVRREPEGATRTSSSNAQQRKMALMAAAKQQRSPQIVPAQPPPSATAGAAPAMTPLSPDVKRKVNYTLDRLQAAGEANESLRRSAAELERECSALERKLLHQRQDIPSPTTAAAAATGVASPSTLSISERDRRRPTCALRVVDAGGCTAAALRELCGDIGCQADMLAEDALLRWGTNGKNSNVSSVLVREFSSSAPLWNTSDAAAGNESAVAHGVNIPHSRFESLIGQQQQQQSDQELSSSNDDAQKLVCRLAMIECLEKVNEQLLELCKSGTAFGQVELPAVETVVKSLLERTT